MLGFLPVWCGLASYPAKEEYSERTAGHAAAVEANPEGRVQPWDVGIIMAAGLGGGLQRTDITIVTLNWLLSHSQKIWGLYS